MIKPVINAAVIFVLAVLFLSSGCGSVHVGGTTHTHIYGSEVVQSDDAVTSGIAGIIQKIRAVSGREAGELDGFKWDNERITRVEKEQKRREEEKWY